MEELVVVALQRVICRGAAERHPNGGGRARGCGAAFGRRWHPGDCRLLEARDLCVDEAALTGESLPVEHRFAQLPADTPLAGRCNPLHLDSHGVSGTAIAERPRPGRGETESEPGVRRFGHLLVEITLISVALLFAFNVLLARPVVMSFLVALALGLTPELPPAAISVNPAEGARERARRRVIVRRLTPIENFDAMDMLRSDKTGTLTEGHRTLLQSLAAGDSLRFRSGWFVESRLSGALEVLLLRTLRPLLARLPCWAPSLATLVVCLVRLVLPATLIGAPLGILDYPVHSVTSLPRRRKPLNRASLAGMIDLQVYVAVLDGLSSRNLHFPLPCLGLLFLIPLASGHSAEALKRLFFSGSGL